MGVFLYFTKGDTLRQTSNKSCHDGPQSLTNSFIFLAIALIQIMERYDLKDEDPTELRMSGVVGNLSIGQHFS